MAKRMIAWSCLLVVVASTLPAWGYGKIYYLHEPHTHRWDDPNAWYAEDIAGPRLPNQTDQVYIHHGLDRIDPRFVVITEGVDARAYDLNIGISHPAPALYMTGGTLTVQNNWMIGWSAGDTNALLDISGGTATANSWVWVAPQGNGSHLQVRGDGELIIHGDGSNEFLIGLPPDDYKDASADVAENGRIVLMVTEAPYLQDYVDAGVLTGNFGKPGQVDIVVDPGAGTTTITAKPCPPGDVDGDCDVDVDDLMTMSEQWLSN